MRRGPDEKKSMGLDLIPKVLTNT